MPFAIRVLLGLVAGFALGAGIARTDGGWAARIPGLVEPVGTIFINAIRLAVIPLVMSSLVVGTATSGDARRVSRFGLRALAMILVALLAAALWAAVIAVPTLQRVMPAPQASAGAPPPAAPPPLSQWFVDLVPANVFKAAADGALLPLVVFSVVFGLALTKVEEARRAAVVQFFRGIYDAFIVIVRAVVWCAPVGVFALAVPLAARLGVGAAGALAWYVGVLSAISAGFIVLLYPAAVLFGGVSLRQFARAAAASQAVGFTSRSSLAALPAAFEGARAGLRLDPEVTEFFLPLAASIFRVGAAMAQMVAVIFLARLYGVPLGLPQLGLALVTIIVTSLTAPGVPGGAVLVIMPVLATLGIPAEGVGVLLAVDSFPDMFRTAANVTGWLSVGSILGRKRAAQAEPAASGAAGA